MKVTVDFVTESEDGSEWACYLVEQGPWSDSDQRLHDIQKRLYDVVDAAIDGRLVEQFPQSMGKAIRIQLDCYDSAPKAIESLASRLNEYIRDSEEYQADLARKRFVKQVRIVGRCMS